MLTPLTFGLTNLLHLIVQILSHDHISLPHQLQINSCSVKPLNFIVKYFMDWRLLLFILHPQGVISV